MSIKMFFFRLFYRRKIKSPRPSDVSKHQLFLLGTEMQFGGRRYYYTKAGADIGVKK